MPPISHPTEPTRGAGRTPRPSATRLIVSVALLGLIWLALAGPDDPSSWIIGLPAVAAAAWSYSRLSPRGPSLSLLGALRFVPYFLVESVKGGIDVARRVLGPRLDVDPGLLDYRLRLSRTASRVFFADLVSLLPGTLSADLEGDRVRIHALDRQADAVPELMRLERRVAALFNETLPESGVPAP